MRKISYLVAQLAIVAVASSMFACGGKEAEKKAEKKEAKKVEVVDSTKKVVERIPGDTTSVPTPSGGQINIRFVDSEKLSQEYSLAKDVQESLSRIESKYISAQESRAKDIQNLITQFETKNKNNEYKSDSERNSDAARINRKQQEAGTYLQNLQRTSELESLQLQTQLQDSISNYLKQFCLENGYDAVLMKAATFYYNPAFDVTDKVIEGLNARYNKVQK